MEEEELTLKSYLHQLVKHRVQDEMEKYIDKLKELEKRIEDLQQKSNALKARVDGLEKAQRSVTEVVIRI